MQGRAHSGRAVTASRAGSD